MAASVDDLRAVERLIQGLPPKKLEELIKLPGIASKLEKGWLPNPGAQTRAVQSPADELFYGGVAGGGKSDILQGIALTEHKMSLILRRTNKEASRFITRFAEIVGHKDGWNDQKGVFSFPDGRRIEFGGCQLEDDKQKYKGDPRDLVGFDEISDFSETQYRFIKGWNRSVDTEQRCRVVACGNPPTKPSGYWVKTYWGAWLLKTHPNPAEDGELRWYTTIEGKDQEVDGQGPHMIGGRPIMARSRTYIRAELKDNPDLDDAGYESVLAALPDGIRQAYYLGDFDAYIDDDDWQVIPTSWIIAAQDRWEPDGWKKFNMTAAAIDPAGGGLDSAELACRHGGWYAKLVSAQGEDTADGTAMAAMVIRYRKDGCPIVIDIGGGYAGAIIERFKDNTILYHKYDGRSDSMASARGSGLKFANKRAEVWWKFREALEPE